MCLPTGSVLVKAKQCLYIATCFGVLMLMVYLRYHAFVPVDNLPLVLLPCVMVAAFPWQPAQAELADKPVQPVVVGYAPTRTAPECSPLATPLLAIKPRYDYLDNVKAFLAFIVVTHHVACSFGDTGGVPVWAHTGVWPAIVLGDQDVWSSRVATGLITADQGYFISLLCFISGHFTPASHARKGTREFIKGKLIRYGIPYLVYFWCLNPLCWLWLFLMFEPDPAAWAYVPGPGPPWFLQMLLLFNAWYVICPAAPLRLKLPCLAVLCLAGATIGLLQGWILAFGFNMFYIPTSIGSFPFYIIFFYAGCVAARDDWLADLLRWPSWQVVALYCVAVSLLLFNLVAVPFMSPFPPSPDCLPPSPPSPGDTALLPPQRGVDYSTLPTTLLVFGAVEGVYTVAFSLATLHFFGTFLNSRNRAWDFLANAAYAVYILHFVLLAPCVYAYLAILRASGTSVNITYCFARDAFYSTTPLKGWQLSTGFLFTTLLINLPLWPTAYYLRKLPGFSRVL